MKSCPNCRTVDLLPGSDFDPVPNQMCDACLGRWVSLDDYEAWLLHQPAPEWHAGHQPRPLPVTIETNRVHYCPEDGHEMTKHLISDSRELYLDRCGRCGGMWFDRQEWELLRSRGLQRAVHHLFLTPWDLPKNAASNSAVVPNQVDMPAAMGLPEVFTSTEREEIESVLTWLAGHPHREDILRLLRNPRSSSPRP